MDEDPIPRLDEVGFTDQCEGCETLEQTGCSVGGGDGGGEFVDGLGGSGGVLGVSCT